MQWTLSFFFFLTPVEYCMSWINHEPVGQVWSWITFMPLVMQFLPYSEPFITVASGVLLPKCVLVRKTVCPRGHVRFSLAFRLQRHKGWNQNSNLPEQMCAQSHYGCFLGCFSPSAARRSSDRFTVYASFSLVLRSFFFQRSWTCWTINRPFWHRFDREISE